MIAKVFVPCLDDDGEQIGWTPVDQVEFLNIEEDIQGRDVMTFLCPWCLNDHKSLVTKGG